MEIEPSKQNTVAPAIHKDVLLYIFDFLQVKDIVKASEVCKLWNKVSKDDLIWKGERGQFREKSLAKIKERKEKELLRQEKVRNVNRDVIRILSIHTPFHDVAYIVLFMISVILTSLRVDNIISTRYLYLFIPGLISTAGWTIKGISGIFLHKRQQRLTNLFEITGLFTESGVLGKGGNPLLFSLLFALFFFIVFVTSIVFTLQMELDGVPPWSVFVPMIVLFIAVAYMSFSNCGKQFLFTSSSSEIEKPMRVAAFISFEASILFSIFLLMCLLQVAEVINWKWSIIHIPIWIQHFLGLVVPLLYSVIIRPDKKKAPQVIMIIWGIVAAPWLLFHILLVLRLDVTSKMKIWGVMIPLLLQLAACLFAACVGVYAFSDEPVGQLWYFEMISVYSLRRAKDRDPREGLGLVYCWRGVLRDNKAIKG